MRILAKLPEKAMPQIKRNCILFLILTVTGCGATPPLPPEQIYMQTEDSHPHEVSPGQASRFPFWMTGKSGYIDVKCTLSGPGIPYEIRFTGIEPKGWAVSNGRGVLNEVGIGFDLEGDISGSSSRDVFFEFVNHSPSELLWHQCYNN